MNARQLELVAIRVSALTCLLRDPADPSTGEFGPQRSTASQAVHAEVFFRDPRFGRVVRRRVASDTSRRERSDRRAALTAAESRKASAISGSRTATLAPSFTNRR